jgi:hypothetical protein
MNQTRTSIATAVLLWTLPGMAANAATVQREEVRMSADGCQPALPAFDGAFRKRPLAMQNEGTSAAFVTCAFGTLPAVDTPTQKTVTVGFTNVTTTAKTVNCTLVDAHAGMLDPTFFPKSISVPPAGSPVALLIWTGTINQNTPFMYPAASCSIPPGVGVQVLNHTYDEDVGL